MLPLPLDYAFKKLEEYDHRFKALRNKEVQVGIFTDWLYDDGTSLIEVARIHEYGLGAMLERSFLRVPISENRYLLMQKSREAFRAGDISILGDFMVEVCQQAIMDHIEPELSAKTIAKKGHEIPLVDTWLLYEHIEYRVIAR